MAKLQPPAILLTKLDLLLYRVWSTSNYVYIVYEYVHTYIESSPVQLSKNLSRTVTYFVVSLVYDWLLGFSKFDWVACVGMRC